MGITKNDRYLNHLGSAFSRLCWLWRHSQLCKFIGGLQESKCKAHHTITISAVELPPIFVNLLCRCILSIWVGTPLYAHIFLSRNFIKLFAGYMNSLLVWTFSAVDPSGLQPKVENHWSGLCTGERQWPAAAACQSLENTSDKANYYISQHHAFYLMHTLAVNYIISLQSKYLVVMWQYYCNDYWKFNEKIQCENSILVCFSCWVFFPPILFHSQSSMFILHMIMFQYYWNNSEKFS